VCVASWQHGGMGRTAEGKAHSNGTWVHEALCLACQVRLGASDNPPRHVEEHELYAKAAAVERRAAAKAAKAAAAEAQTSMGADWGRR
jgi:hypothetical protein